MVFELKERCDSLYMAKRVFDLFFSLVGLAVLSPLLLGIALAVRLRQGGPVFFSQQRVGLNGRLFSIWKFRTMVVDSERLGLGITKSGDPRITPLGRFLRRTKLDELPQLWNVLKGDMSFVGPRPEIPKYTEHYTDEQKKVLKLKPGITDVATLAFRNEEELLKSASDVEVFYLKYCLPRKIEMNLSYSQTANIWRDTLVIINTVVPGLGPRGSGKQPGMGKSQ